MAKKSRTCTHVGRKSNVDDHHVSSIVKYLKPWGKNYTCIIRGPYVHWFHKRHAPLLPFLQQRSTRRRSEWITTSMKTVSRQVFTINRAACSGQSQWRKRRMERGRERGGRDRERGIEREREYGRYIHITINIASNLYIGWGIASSIRDSLNKVRLHDCKHAFCTD